MVAIVKPGKSLRSSFDYNEKKVRAGAAEFIHSANYGKDADQLSRKDRLNRLVKQAARNERAKFNSIHVTINFHTDEKLTKESLQKIVDSYMHQIGLGGQPYLVYQHKDAIHPHVHVVSTPVRLDGTRIRTFTWVRDHSLAACRAIEKEFGLVRAESYRLRQTNQTHPAHPGKIEYGKTETLRAIADVLEAVLPKYTYTSLAELNGVLRDYNVIADEGSENSRLRQLGGLVYRVIDERGKKVGRPVKASDIYSKPTLKFLQTQFARNKQLLESEKSHPEKTSDRQEAFLPTPEKVPSPTPEKVPPPTPKEKISSEDGLQKERQRKRKRLHL